MVVPCKNEIKFKVYINDDEMDPVIVDVAQKKLVKTMQKVITDHHIFVLVVSPPSGKKWIANKLAVVDDSKEAAGDMISEIVINQIEGKERRDEERKRDVLVPKFRNDSQDRAPGSKSQGSGKSIHTNPLCGECGRNHKGMCRASSDVCFGCGKIGHKVSLLIENSDDALLDQVKDGFAEGKDLVLSVMSFIGEEQICGIKDIGPK
ncbi:hypothetical protein CQW23_14630 [Capsicum baccatum]|uniref:Translation initiation factor 5A C-terminal domain-containing protein n=1 Tax=Capsicum baccatum TaxID=33114 RepID=A0A2G2WJT1_CAPBA|nr:hypothetical protein CQW23_14630 [Capsicum baccatum]